MAHLRPLRSGKEVISVPGAGQEDTRNIAKGRAHFHLKRREEGNQECFTEEVALVGWLGLGFVDGIE